MNQKESASVFQQLFTFLLVMLPVLIVAALFGSHISFQKRVVAVMKHAAAQELGLLPQAEPSPFDPGRIWIAKSKDGQFEFRSAWPLIGSVPFELFGSGTTETDLLVACERLGDSACRRL